MRGDMRRREIIHPWIVRAYRSSWIRWSLVFILSYGISTALLFPLLFRQQILPLLEHRTGAAITIQAIHWHPYALKVSFNGISVGASPELALISSEQIDVDVGLIRSLLHRAWALDGITIVQPMINIHTTGTGATDLEELLSGIKTRNEELSSPSDQTTSRIALCSLQLRNGHLTYTSGKDRVPLDLRSIDLEIDGFKSWGNDKTAFNLSFKMDETARIQAIGTILPGESSGVASVEALNLNLASLQALFPHGVELPHVEGVLNVSGDLQVEGASSASFKLAHVHVDLQRGLIRDPQSSEPIIALGKLGLDEGLLDLADQRVDVGSFELEELGINAKSDAAGQPGWTALIPQSNATISLETSSSEAKESNSSWKVAVDHLQLDHVFFLPKPEDTSVFRPDITLGKFEGEGIKIDTGSRSFLVSQLGLEETQVHLALDKDAIHPLDVLFPSSASPNVPVAQDGAGSAPWSLRVGKTEVRHFELAMIRLGAKDAIPFEFKNIALNLGSIDTASQAETPMALAAEVSPGGKLALNGTLNIKDQSLNSEVSIDHIGLKPLKSLLSDSFRFDTVEGFLSSRLKIEGQLQGGAAFGEYEGSLQLESLRLTQSPADRKLLAWRNLDVQGIQGKVTPPVISINDIRLIDPDGVIAIHEDKGSNLSDLRVSPNPDTHPPSPKTVAAKQAATNPDIHIRRIRVEGGKLDYSDQSLILPFSTQIVDLKGAITGWTLDPSGKSLVELNGRIAPYGEAAIHGQLRPHDPRSSLDLDLHFENVVLASLTPYTATFAGRRIEDGKLDLNAHYQLEDQTLKSENRIYLKRLRLGEKVDSPKAVSLPLDLAVAVLSDAEGNIDLSLPIDGRTDAPDFDYGAIVINALGNLIKKTVLSPITAMVGALGIQGGDDLDAIAFDLGSDLLTPPEKEKIARLAQALNLKPQLQLTLIGVYSPQQDLEMLRSLWLRQLVAARLGEASKVDEEPDPVNPTDPSTQRVLETIAKEFSLTDQVVLRYTADTGHIPDRVGIVGHLFGKASKTPDFYEQLIKAILVQSPIGMPELKDLAERREKSVRMALTKSHPPIEVQRIHSGEFEERISEDNHHLQMPLNLQIN